MLMLYIILFIFDAVWLAWRISIAIKCYRKWFV